MVTEATEQRKEENEDFTELIASDSAAKELIGFAKNRLLKFYNPKLYTPPPKRELTEDERITVNMGGTLAPTPPPAGRAGTAQGRSSTPARELQGLCQEVRGKRRRDGDDGHARGGSRQGDGRGHGNREERAGGLRDVREGCGGEAC